MGGSHPVYSIANKVGRLLEVSITTPVSLEEANRAFIEIRHVVDALGGKAVVVCDLTRADIFAPEVADKLTLLMRTHNSLLERSAFLISDGPTFGMQFMRMIREAGGPSRRLFKRRFELEAWLSEVLSPPERERMRVFLDEALRPRE